MKNLFIRILCFIGMLTFVLPLLLLSASAETVLPDAVITEVCFNSTYEKNDFDITSSADVMDFIEIYNTSGRDLDLTGWTVSYRHGGWNGEIVGVNKVTQILSEGGYVLKAGEFAIFAIYSKYCAPAGLKYDTAEEFEAVFNKFTDINGGKSRLAVRNFYLIPHTESGKTENIAGTFGLENDVTDAVLTVLDKSGRTVCECSYNADERNRNNYSLNMMFTGKVEGHPTASEPFNIANPTPGKLFENQIVPLAKGLTPDEGVRTIPLTLMEYNVCATDSEQTHGDGGAVTMDDRAAGVMQTVKNNDPDVLCMCEINYLWVKYVNGSLDGEGCGYSSYGHSSTGKTWGNSNVTNGVWDLFNLILWKKEKYELIESGTFWCSKTPDKRNSYIWEDGTVGDFGRAINWVILEEKTTGARFFVLCQHIDAKSAHSRDLSTALIVRKADELSKGLPVFMTGDWNCGDASTAYANIIESGKYADSRYITVSPESMTLYGSFNSWGENTKMTAMAPIDHCFVSKDTVFAKTVKTDYGLLTQGENLYASDHNATVYSYDVTVFSDRPEETTAEETTGDGTSVVETEDTSAANVTEAASETSESADSSGCKSSIGALGILGVLSLAVSLKKKDNV